METVRQGRLGKFDLRVVRTKTGFAGVINGASGRQAMMVGPDDDALWKALEREAARIGDEFVGYAGARSRFLRFFPGGMSSPRYLEGERQYKVSAKVELDRQIPLAEAVSGTGFGAAALEVYRKTNLLHPRFEKTRIAELLKSNAADGFIRAAARFAKMPTKEDLLEMAHRAKPFMCAKWTVLTYLPFLWRPDQHMFLKPEVTKKFAERVGHPFHLVYDAAPSMNVYQSLLDLTAETQAEIAAFEPQDQIDVQSFIWVVASYTDNEEPDEGVRTLEAQSLNERVLRG